MTTQPSPLDRLNAANEHLRLHVSLACPDCQKRPLLIVDEYEDLRDRVVRTWSCPSCSYKARCDQLPIAEWSSDVQQRWYSKAAKQRAAQSLTRCPNCGNESIHADEAGVPSVGTSQHIVLLCQTLGCTFTRRKVERSLFHTARSLVRYAVLLVVVLAGTVILAWVLGLPRGRNPTPQPDPSSTASTSTSQPNTLSVTGTIVTGSGFLQDAQVSLVGTGCVTKSNAVGYFEISGCGMTSTKPLASPKLRIEVRPGIWCESLISLDAPNDVRVDMAHAVAGDLACAKSWPAARASASSTGSASPTSGPTHDDVAKLVEACCNSTAKCPTELVSRLLNPKSRIDENGKCQCGQSDCCVPADTVAWLFHLTSMSTTDFRGRPRKLGTGAKVCVRLSGATPTPLFTRDQCVGVEELNGAGRRTIRVTTPDIVKNGIDLLIIDQANQVVTKAEVLLKKKVTPDMVCRAGSTGFSYNWSDEQKDWKVNVMGYFEEP